jgi:hypothetical protein
MREVDLMDVLLREVPEDQVLDAVEEIWEPDNTSALRWMCRGLNPDMSRALHLLRGEMREQRMEKTEADPTP